MSDRTGQSSVGLIVTINDAIFNDEAVLGFTMTSGINMLPYGTLKLSIAAPDKFELKSGCYGSIAFIRASDQSLNGKGFSIYIFECNLERDTEHTAIANIRWKLGTAMSMSQSSIALPGTSTDALETLFKSHEYTVNKMIDPDVLSTDNDTMVWRIVNSNIEDAANYIVEHSYIPNDYLFWTFDEYQSAFVLATIKFVDNASVKNAAVWNQDAFNATGGAMYTDSKSGAILWQFCQETRSDIKGEKREDVFPNLVFSTVTNGNAEVSMCKGGCFGIIAQQSGSKSNAVAKSEYQMDKDYTYGEMAVVEQFPMNTHPMYHVAKSLRNRAIGEYTKRMQITLENEIGPAVGTVLVVATYPYNRSSGNTTPDMTYSDTYFVIAKQVQKSVGTSNGILGVEGGENSASYKTVLTLVSANTDTMTQTVRAMAAVAYVAKLGASIKAENE